MNVMSHEFQAIHENGVLRPIEPLSLKEHQLVRLSLAEKAAGTLPDVDNRAVIQAQRKAIAEMLEATAKLPEVPQHDGLSPSLDRKTASQFRSGGTIP
jgi:predicted DNA-binding antitoxin AbrB/MazE fold protein